MCTDSGAYILIYLTGGTVAVQVRRIVVFLFLSQVLGSTDREVYGTSSIYEDKKKILSCLL